jgi:hypothetical protein
MVKRALFYTLVLLGILALFMGCATTNADGSPKWTTKVPSNWRTYYATGYGKLSNVQNSRMRAEALATDAVARWASVTVQASLTNYIYFIGVGQKNKHLPVKVSALVLPPLGIEPRTQGFSVLCSTN